MNITLIAAMARNNVIGKNNQIPWHIPADFKHFKQTTMHHPMVMGRKTFESLPGLLPGRPHIVVSRIGFEAEGIIPALSLEDGLEKANHIARKNNQNTVFVIGGGQIYTQALPLATHMKITQIHHDYDGDAFFPPWNEQEWLETHRHYIKGEPSYSFVSLERRAA